MFDALDRADGSKGAGIIRAPFGYPGGKSRSVLKILPHLPYRGKYIEPFGGSGAVLLARERHGLEVYNDAFGGVVAFYRCIRDKKMMDLLMTRLELSLHAKEEFIMDKQWNVDDPIERAARWYRMVQTSFGSIGRNWGRSTGTRSFIAGKVQSKLKHFPMIHRRMKRVQVENCDWEEIFDRYDCPEAVFYCDPPYVDVYGGTYKNELSIERHKDLIRRVFDAEGFVAVSGYSNPLYEDNDWDERYTWKSFVSIQSIKNSEENKKGHLKDQKRTHAEEVLWIKH